MNEAGTVGATGAVTAGRLLREARQAQGLHIAALASAIKVTPRKLELLEADRFDELPDATFTRALAQTVCRSLKVDAAPILALLPPPRGHRLEHVGEGLNTPFHERPSRLEPSDWTHLARPAIWGPALLLLAAAAVYFMPAGWLPSGRSPDDKGAGSKAGAVGGFAGTAASGPMPAAIPELPSGLPATTEASAALAGAAPAPSDEVASAVPGSATLAATASAPSGAAAIPGSTDAGTAPSSNAATVASVSGGATTPPADTATDKPLRLTASADSWIEVLDARGRALLSRLVRAGETIDLEGALPMRLKVGNARATAIAFRGRPVELEPYTRDNVARFELK